MHPKISQFIAPVKKRIRGLAIACLVVVLAVCCVSSYRLDQKRRDCKADLVEISDIKYGLFNTDVWKNIISTVLERKIKEFEINPEQRTDLQIKVSEFLRSSIPEIEKSFLEENSKNTLGMLKIGLVSATDLFSQIKKNIPSLSEKIVAALNSPENKQSLKNLLTTKLREYVETNSEAFDYSRRDAIQKKYALTDPDSLPTFLTGEVEKTDQDLSDIKRFLAFGALAVGIFLLTARTLTLFESTLLTLACFFFLLVGLFLPMIEIEARISEIKIDLLGEIFVFQNQVLYHKSKSVLEVVLLMIRGRAFDLQLVGWLIFAFSVLFPVLKLTSVFCCLFHPPLRSNKTIDFLLNRIGKWSMADVMVVAIFMAYVGFSGILTEQLHQLENSAARAEILTTNGSSLQTGFFAFLAFVILSLLKTRHLERSASEKAEAGP